jgi:hypothetical protein
MKADQRTASRRQARGRGAVALRFISAVSLGSAIFAAVLLLILRLIHCFQPDLLPWTFKSGIPLILIGIAFASFQFALPRARAQILSGLMVAAAFILWGTEQFLSNQAIVSFMDDMVVFLFVLDLSIVIYGPLKAEAHPPGKEQRFDGGA